MPKTSSGPNQAIQKPSIAVLFDVLCCEQYSSSESVRALNGPIQAWSIKVIRTVRLFLEHTALDRLPRLCVLHPSGDASSRESV